MKVINLTSKIIQFDFQSREELARTFLRFQEHYECPNNEFRNRPFTLGEYRNWAIKQNGKFTYYKDWDGFNIPSYMFKPFRNGSFDPLTKEEQTLLSKLKGKREPFYVVGTFKGGKDDVLEHELCHALWYSEPKYREEAEYLVKKYSTKLKPLFKWIENSGYNKDVVLDEAHAYISADYDWLVNDKNFKIPEELYLALRLLREEYSLGNNNGRN